MDRARFVVLKHAQPTFQVPNERRSFLAGSVELRPGEIDVHFDFMLQSPAGLLTWAIPIELEELAKSTTPVPAVELPPHRAAYLDYQGPVSGDRGSVLRVMSGSFRWIEPAGEELLFGELQQVSVLLSPTSMTDSLQVRLERLYVQKDKFRLHCDRVN